MLSNNRLNPKNNLQQNAYQCLCEKNYSQASLLYEKAIELEPNIKTNYWYLGLALLLQDKEIEAQTTWLLGMTEGEPEEVDLWTEELKQILVTEAEKQRELNNCPLAWTIRKHIQEITPHDINNLLHLLGLSTLTGEYTGEEVIELGIIEIIQSQDDTEIDIDLLVLVLKAVVDKAPLHPSTYELIETCITYIKTSWPILELIIPLIAQIGYAAKEQSLAIKFAKLGLNRFPNEPELLRMLAAFYQDIYELELGLETAKLCYSMMNNLADKIYANQLIMRGLMNAGGRWEEFISAIENQKSMLLALCEEQPKSLDSSATIRLFSSTFFFPYFQDNLQENVTLRHQVASLGLLNVENYARTKITEFRQDHNLTVRTNDKKRLKIGYISHCLRQHSVGWLARWIFSHRNREDFDVTLYLIGTDLLSDSIESWYINKVDKYYKLGIDGLEATRLIYEDGIDILVDLDSITLTTTCEVLAIKPAPIQVTWLGCDASGIPTVDYFLADPYVLPDCAQDYYSEKIWRLPQTYIAVDGFELGIPTLRRENVNIPNDAVIYLSMQRAYKINPHIARLQLKIIKDVPNSYFLIKGLADQESLKNFFMEIAESEGVNFDKLKFIDLDGTELEHRANLAIADVVLDTYPYNGATTTMETLWMCVPIVTRVGEQFAARNSYTMMMNAGITEGIAWSDEEYVEWGIRFGTDEKLRQQVSWKLRQSKQTAPLWNGKQFTREMEKAYQEMWEIYQGGEK